MTLDFLSFPREVHFAILSNLPFKDWKNVKKTCKPFYAIIFSTELYMEKKWEKLAAKYKKIEELTTEFLSTQNESGAILNNYLRINQYYYLANFKKSVNPGINLWLSNTYSMGKGHPTNQMLVNQYLEKALTHSVSLKDTSSEVVHSEPAKKRQTPEGNDEIPDQKMDVDEINDQKLDGNEISDQKMAEEEITDQKMDVDEINDQKSYGNEISNQKMAEEEITDQKMEKVKPLTQKLSFYKSPFDRIAPFDDYGLSLKDWGNCQMVCKLYYEIIGASPVWKKWCKEFDPNKEWRFIMPQDTSENRVKKYKLAETQTLKIVSQFVKIETKRIFYNVIREALLVLSKRTHALILKDHYFSDIDLNRYAHKYIMPFTQTDNPEMLNLLGIYYFDEKKPMEINNIIRKNYLMKAAEKGHAAAQKNLGKCYKYGFGCAIDLYAATDFFEQAAAQGDKEAIWHLTQ